ncbi:MAG TPA: YcxB family protein [Chitinophagaceae bacterium]|nr:YcxB family protein [Chitinophagaceae bacterium]
MIRTSAKAEIQLSWSRFLKWKETKDFFLLFIVEHDVHIISKRNLEQQDLPELRTLLSEKIGLF